MLPVETEAYSRSMREHLGFTQHHTINQCVMYFVDLQREAVWYNISNSENFQKFYIVFVICLKALKK